MKHKIMHKTTGQIMCVTDYYWDTDEFRVIEPLIAELPQVSGDIINSKLLELEYVVAQDLSLEELKKQLMRG